MKCTFMGRDRQAGKPNEFASFGKFLFSYTYCIKQKAGDLMIYVNEILNFKAILIPQTSYIPYIFQIKADIGRCQSGKGALIRLSEFPNEGKEMKMCGHKVQLILVETFCNFFTRSTQQKLLKIPLNLIYIPDANHFKQAFFRRFDPKCIQRKNKAKMKRKADTQVKQHLIQFQLKRKNICNWDLNQAIFQAFCSGVAIYFAGILGGYFRILFALLITFGWQFYLITFEKFKKIELPPRGHLNLALKFNQNSLPDFC